jgi:hypothetical protein
MKPNYHPVNKEGLVGWWAYRNTGSVSATGTWKDYSGNGNDMTLTGSPTVDSSGVNFDGSGGYASSNGDLGLNYATDSYSACAWFKMNTFNQSSNIVGWGNGNVAPFYTWWIGVNVVDGTLYYWTYDGANKSISSSTNAVTVGKWHFACVTQNQTTARLYLDGLEVNSGSLSVQNRTDSEDKISLAKDVAVQVLSMEGISDDVQIYNRVLSAGEIKLNYIRNLRG